MSEYGGDSNIYDQPASHKSGGGGGRLEREVPAESRLGAGRLVDNRVFRHDRLAGKASVRSWHVTKDDRVDAELAASYVEKINVALGVEAADPGELEAIWEAIFFYHTLNSSSIAQPGRSHIVVGGTKFSYQDVLIVLGNDNRRFFRAVANEVRDVNRKVIGAAGSRNIEARERHEMLMQVASERGLSRYPELAHDSADACWGLDTAMRAALANSKMAVLNSTSNFVDSTSANSRTIGQRGVITDNPAVGRGQYE